MNDLTRSALEGFIRRKAGADRVAITQAALLSGGSIQENWLVRAELAGGNQGSELDVVVRTDAPSGVAGSHTRAEEFALLTAAFDAGVSVPEPLWMCHDADVIGRQFFVMRRVQGVAASHVVSREPRYGGDRGQLLERLGAELARIHSIRPPRSDLAFLPAVEGSPALHNVRRLRGYLDKHHTPYPALEWGLRWLERNAPPRGEVVLCHRDFRTGNYMVDENGLTGILDWEFSGWGDPLEDVGWFCAKCWRFGGKGEAGGIGAREDFYRGYASVSGRRLDAENIHYWEVMAHLNWAVIAIQQAERHMSGEETSLMLALTGHIVPELEYEILMMTEAA
ncbi:Predicted kinase, aminoglycoside phosphotransferase (APT) family [Aromatoleum tolulyticum]|uniref:Predicted kinase, aminoglycoside phosphotransferase (APT) family n=1 Tax=Aromatoleum tolulyticum TaxID=34027 RepID=A0A1N7C568_9RHOO|nr:phosphotransferase family protein [Aromatoleum tolulyticum]SIR58730.1 Predicted kinase, aminoglycoside phosphotransferase (APT) family [Aromatoleum tolulyticum]